MMTATKCSNSNYTLNQLDNSANKISVLKKNLEAVTKAAHFTLGFLSNGSSVIAMATNLAVLYVHAHTVHVYYIIVRY